MARSGPTGVLGHKRPFPDASPARVLKNSSFARAPDCAVCLQGLEPTRAVFQAPGSAHRFHVTCIVDLASHSPEQDLGFVQRRGCWGPEEVSVASLEKMRPDAERVYPVDRDDDTESLGLVQRTNAFSRLTGNNNWPRPLCSRETWPRPGLMGSPLLQARAAESLMG